MTNPMLVAGWQPSTDAERAALRDAFPEVNPGHWPTGELVLVQVRSPKRKTKGGIIMVDDARDTEKWNTQTAKVIALGPLAYHNKTNLTPWPEGPWCKPGDFVRVRMHGTDRFVVQHGDGDEALFMLVRDHEVLAHVTSNPLDVKAYI
jgi:co-chaperonin GroES (HSP10)